MPHLKELQLQNMLGVSDRDLARIRRNRILRNLAISSGVVLTALALGYGCIQCCKENRELSVLELQKEMERNRTALLLEGAPYLIGDDYSGTNQ